MTAQTKKHLPRLEPKAYRGQAYVHWTMTMEDRRSGWLVPIFSLLRRICGSCRDCFGRHTAFFKALQGKKNDEPIDHHKRKRPWRIAPPEHCGTFFPP